MTRIAVRTRTAFLASGEEIPFDKALIATGARVFVPERLRALFGACANVIAMRRIAEALALKRFLDAGRNRIVIVGAGRIGVLLAEALKRAGARTALVDIAPEILPTMLARDVAARLRPHLEAPPLVTVYAGRAVERAALEDGHVRELLLSDGTALPCDAVVLATGVVPNVEILDAALPGNADGIPVDDRMETPFPGIYAAGDVVWFRTVTGRMEPGQLVLNARLQGEVAARNIAGEKAVCAPLLTANVVRIGHLLGARAGEADGDDWAEIAAGESFLKVTLERGTATGFQFVGDPEDLSGLVPAVLATFKADAIRDAFATGTKAGLIPHLLARALPWA